MVNLQTVTIYGNPVSKVATYPDFDTPRFYGIAYPIGEHGMYFNKASGKKLIRDNLLQMLLTNTGERVMLPTFGAGLGRYLFEPFDEDELEEVTETIQQNLVSFFPSVSLVSVDIGEDAPGTNKITGFPDGNSINLNAVFFHRDLNDLIKIQELL